MIRLLSCELFADRLQFPSAFRGGLGICHLKVFERIKNNSGDDQPGVLLVIGWNDLPGCVMGACRLQAILVSLRVMLPVFPLVNVHQAEFPVFVRLVDAP